MAVAGTPAKAQEVTLEGADVKSSPTENLQADNGSLQAGPSPQSHGPRAEASLWCVELSTHTDAIDAKIEAAAFNYRSLLQKSASVKINPQNSFSVCVGPFDNNEAAQHHFYRLKLDPLAGNEIKVVDMSQYK